MSFRDIFFVRGGALFSGCGEGGGGEGGADQKDRCD